MAKRDKKRLQPTVATGTVIGRLEEPWGDECLSVALTLSASVWERLTADIRPLGKVLPLEDRILLFCRQQAVEWEWLVLRPSLFSTELDDGRAF